ncbi:Ribonuclease H-like protein [Senna tora]|uniref:Ribonuclease H-like protein n=1 Tax=Senna tora TaxID=362788 RepID=A0A834TP78_9FABA|nr:Ribonuclease H-like protein [Senna tora]
MKDNQRLRRGFTDNDICKRCGQSSESAIHAIRDCPVVSGLWKSLVHTRYYNIFFTSNLQDWILCNLSKNMGYEEDLDWSSKFGITCWLVWKQRNQWVFNELWSIYFGLSTARDRGYKKVMLESNSSFVIKLIQDVSFTTHPLKRLILSIRNFLKKDWQVELIHTLREGNYVALSLAVHAHSLPLGLNWFNSTPSFCTDVYRFDSLGVVPLVGS